jgi:hypothetical protein
MNMMRVATLAGLMVLLVAPSFAEPRILSRYSGGGNYYYNPRSSGGPTGYTGASAPIHRNTAPVRKAAPTAVLGAVALPTPCGNFNRVQPRHCPPTKAWDSSFRTVYR